jgi:hypothetical protein
VVGEGLRKEVGAGGEEEGELDTVDVDCAELRRRRKGIEGRRYSGKGVVGELGAMLVDGEAVGVLG